MVVLANQLTYGSYSESKWMTVDAEHTLTFEQIQDLLNNYDKNQCVLKEASIANSFWILSRNKKEIEVKVDPHTDIVMVDYCGHFISRHIKSYPSGNIAKKRKISVFSEP